MAEQSDATPPNGTSAISPSTIDLRDDHHDDETRVETALAWPSADQEADPRDNRDNAQHHETGQEGGRRRFDFIDVPVKPVYSPLPLLGRLAIAGVAIWLVAWLVAPAVVRGGVADPGLVSLVILVALLWFLLGWFLRIAGWIIAGVSLYDAVWGGATVADTTIRLGAAFALWLCGQWIFTWKHGVYKSTVAKSILPYLPFAIRPDRRFGFETDNALRW